MRIRVLGFGDNSQNQLGDRPSSKHSWCFIVPVPKQVPGIKQLVCGATCSALLDTNGVLYVWGKLATDAPESFVYARPTPVKYFQNNSIRIEKVACRNIHMAALSVGNRIFVWGDNSKKQLPTDSAFVAESNPVEVELPNSEVAVDIACGGFFTLILTQSGTVYGFGANGNHVLGESGLYIKQPTPLYSSFFGQKPAARIFAGWSHAAAIGSDNELYTWGREAFGRLGHSQGEHPHQVLFKEAGLVQSVACGDTSTFVVTTKGPAYSCGWNNSGENGNGDTKSHRGLKRIALPSNVRVAEIAAGTEQTIIMTTDETVFVTGSNTDNRIGMGAAIDGTTSPTQLLGLENVVAVATGVGHSLIAFQTR